MESTKAQTPGERGTALITGASRGIGAAIAIELAKENFAVGLVGREENALQQVAESCRALGVRANYYLTDLRDPAAVADLAKQVATEMGGLTILVNNAGVSIERSIRDATIEQWDTTLDCNLRSVFVLTKEALPFLEKSKGAAIINIASIASRGSYAGGSMYAASKHGVLGFSNSLFHDIRESGVKVCSILPGYVSTAIHAENKQLTHERMIRPCDIASAVRFVVNFPENACPTEITILPQRSPK